MAASRPKKLKKKLKKGAASRRQKAKKPCFYLFIRLKKNPDLRDVAEQGRLFSYS